MPTTCSGAYISRFSDFCVHNNNDNNDTTDHFTLAHVCGVNIYEHVHNNYQYTHTHTHTQTQIVQALVPSSTPDWPSEVLAQPASWKYATNEANGALFVPVTYHWTIHLSLATSLDLIPAFPLMCLISPWIQLWLVNQCRFYLLEMVWPKIILK